MIGEVESAVDVVATALREHAGDLRAFVCARVPADEAEDVLQVAAMRAVERADTLSDPARVRAWLYRLHRNVIVDSVRRRERQRRLLEDAAREADVAQPAVTAAEQGELCKCSVSLAQQLKPVYSSVLALVDTGNATVSEAARVLGISANNAAVRLHRARAALRDAMRQHCGVASVEDCDDCRCVHDGCCPV